MYDLLCFVSLCSLNCRFSSLFYSSTFQCRDLNDLASKYFAEFVNKDLVTVFLNNVHHVDRHDNRDSKLQQLCGQIQVSLKVSSVYNVQDRIRTLRYQISSGYNLLQSIWRQGVDSWKVHDHYIRMSL